MCPRWQMYVKASHAEPGPRSSRSGAELWQWNATTSEAIIDGVFSAELLRRTFFPTTFALKLKALAVGG